MEPGPPSPSADLMDVLLELLNKKMMTAEILETYIHEHPDLLGPHAQTLLSVLAAVQDSPEARAAVNNMARILVRLQNESITVVFADEATRARQQAAAQRRETRLRLARDKFLAWQKEPKKAPGTTSHPRPLPSLSEVVAQLRSISAAESTQGYGRDLLRGQAAGDSIPAYLFRGESGTFPETFSSMARFKSNLSPEVLESILKVRDFLIPEFQERWDLTSQQTLGFLQHYGYPTDFIDVTSDTSVAASFASFLRVGEEGAIGIVPTHHLKKCDSLVDLRHHPVARRPPKQSAFAIHIPDYPDLKAPETKEALGITWIPFRLTEIDAARFVPDFTLLDARSDPVAGLIWLMISEYGKFKDVAASFLARRIDPAPFFAIAQRDGKMVVVSEDEVSPDHSVDDEQFRRSKYETWSDAFAAPEQKPLPPELAESLLTESPKPGSVVQLLTSRAIKKSEQKRS